MKGMRRLPRLLWATWQILLSGLLILGGFIAWSLAAEHDKIEKQEQERLATQAKVIDDNLCRQIASINRALLSVRDDIPYWQDRKNGWDLAAHQLKALADALPGVHDLTILDADGFVRASSREMPARSFREREYFQAPLKQRDLETIYVSEPFTNVFGTWVITLSRMVRGPDGKFDGIVLAALDAEAFTVLLDSVLYAPDMWSVLAHGDGKIFVMSPQRPERMGMSLAQPDSLFTRHRDSGQAATVMSGIALHDGDYRMLAQRTLQPSRPKMDKPLVIGVSRDMNAPFAEWRDNALIQGGLFALIVLSSIPNLYRLHRRQRAAEEDAAAAEAALHSKNLELAELNAELATRSEMLRRQANHDGLTGIINRRHFDESLQAEWRRSQREGLPLALLMIDIDHFKLFNDRYGHQAGDACLKSVAAALRQRLGRPYDVVARYGGEEFVCMLPNCDLSGAETIAEELRAAVEALCIAHECSPTAAAVTISIGAAAAIPSTASGPEVLLADADAALYVAKHNGRNQVRLATASAC